MRGGTARLPSVIKGYAAGGEILPSLGKVSNKRVTLAFEEKSGATIDVETDESIALKVENYFRKYAQ